MASRSMPGLDSIRSTCLPACFGLRPLAAARPAPIAQTASEAARSAPVVASASEAIRLACRSAPRIGSRKSRTRSCDSVPFSDMLRSGSREPAACPGNYRAGGSAVRNARCKAIPAPVDSFRNPGSAARIRSLRQVGAVKMRGGLSEQTAVENIVLLLAGNAVDKGGDDVAVDGAGRRLRL